ncbi:MAG: hypothetical protein GX354_11900 [Firmicutes bacterium]|nr:hypothetical protein [Bacillota bacterium]
MKERCYRSDDAVNWLISILASLILALLLSGRAFAETDFIEWYLSRMPEESARFFRMIIYDEPYVGKMYYPIIYEFDKEMCWMAYLIEREEDYDRSWLSKYPREEEHGQTSINVLGLMMYYATLLPECFLEEEISRINKFSPPAGAPNRVKDELLGTWAQFLRMRAGQVMVVNDKSEFEWIYNPELAREVYSERIGYIGKAFLSFWEWESPQMHIEIPSIKPPSLEQYMP